MMKFYFLAVLILIVGCKEYGTGHTIENEGPSAEIPILPKKPAELPVGAVKADFTGTEPALFAYVKDVDPTAQTTTIGFENKKLPQIIIPESIGAELQILKLKNFDRDILLINAKLKDTNFNEYYVYVWKDTSWLQPVNRFDIHKSNMTDTLIPISSNPKDSTQLLRYYSVFNMDRKSEKKFTWKLMRESVTIEN